LLGKWYNIKKTTPYTTFSQLLYADILLKAIFVPKSGQAPKLEIQEKIIYIIAYAVTVLDTEPKNVSNRYNIMGTKVQS
jgi:hypothetical protein